MALDDKEIEKYIFDPKNPKQCKSYKLLLNIAKRDPLVYVSSDFITLDYEKDIVGTHFNNELWDKPDNYEELSVLEKVQLFKDLLSENDYDSYIDAIEIDEERFTYNKLFRNFIDFVYFGVFTSSLTYEKAQYDVQLLKLKLKSIKERKASYINDGLKGSKIIFDNDTFSYLEQSSEIFDRASVIVTELKNKHIFQDYQIHKNLKPLYLKNIEDIKILLNVLQEDLKREKFQHREIEAIHTLESIKIKDFFSIKDIELQNLQDKKEIYIVGENGDGKTLLLQALALGLKGIDDGDVFDLVKSQKEYDICIEDEQKNIYDAKEKDYKNFFAYGANRNSSCQLKEDEKGYLTLFNATLDLKNPISWLQYLDHREKSGKNNIVSSSQVKKLLQEMLHRDVEIEITPDEVTFKERGAPVTFEQLSAGYTGVITIVIDLLSRLSENQPEVAVLDEFRGVVVIDEVELHLHPKWKYDFVNKLREIFPNLQFIMTTHSPTVILGASKEAVFYKIYKEDGEVKISNQIANEGYTSNTLISSPLFDLSSIASREYEKSTSNKDDFIYEQIHERISKKISMESLEDKEKIAKLIDEELAKL
jgi:predicted ATP-binding protein involved in virulence